MTRLGVSGLVLAIALVAAPAAAQDFVDAAPGQQRPPTPPPATQTRRPATPAKKKTVGLRAYFLFDYEALLAKQTFDAVVGKSQVMGFGGGMDITGIWKNLFLRVSMASISLDGTRVFIVDNEPVSLNVPITVNMKPVDLSLGWRVTPVKKPKTPPRPPGAGRTTPPPPPPPPVRPPAPPPRGGTQGRPATPATPPGPPGTPSRFSYYVGLGGLFLKYEESSKFSSAEDNTHQTFGGYTAFGGFDVRLSKHLFAGLEGQFRGLPNAIGNAGVSKSYSENNLGGGVVRVVIGFKK